MPQAIVSTHLKEAQVAPTSKQQAIDRDQANRIASRQRTQTIQQTSTGREAARKERAQASLEQAIACTALLAACAFQAPITLGLIPLRRTLLAWESTVCVESQPSLAATTQTTMCEVAPTHPISQTRGRELKNTQPSWLSKGATQDSAIQVAVQQLQGPVDRGRVVLRLMMG